MEIYPSCKVKHFTALSEKTGIPFHEMIFFDDLSWNIQDARQLGIHAHHVPNGITVSTVRRAIKEYEHFASERKKNMTPK
ncbi:Magnesium-dependent phosphatase 1 [Fasciolopsis buskii]|uniref:Magnesium-dependent phosphatase 1 n=1 Tax=Fasciolopsis buskii TaxID=27845 RepID=A0A8E0RVE5_9TREM|nr:Magnesium-dependent phosphatase 1 [Fasciolopsis buski]